jgi:hypothetical protein
MLRAWMFNLSGLMKETAGENINEARWLSRDFPAIRQSNKSKPLEN